jgi:hypothetical protein
MQMMQMDANGCKWMQMDANDANGCKWMQMDANDACEQIAKMFP